jgi:hypothetical protein
MDLILVVVQRLDASLVLYVPELDQPIRGSRHELRPLTEEVDSKNRVRMALKRLFRISGDTNVW